MKKWETCGPLLLVYMIRLDNMIWSVLHHFSVKSGQRVGGIFDIADYIYS